VQQTENPNFEKKVQLLTWEIMNKPRRKIEISTECNTSGVFPLSFFSGATFVNYFYKNATYFNNGFAIDFHWSNIRREIYSWHLNVDTQHLQLLACVRGSNFHLASSSASQRTQSVSHKDQSWWEVSNMCTISCTVSVVFVWSQPKLVCLNRY